MPDERKPPDPRLTTTIAVRLTPGLRARAELLAAARGETTSKFFRRVLRQALDYADGAGRGR